MLYSQYSFRSFVKRLGIMEINHKKKIFVVSDGPGVDSLSMFLKALDSLLCNTTPELAYPSPSYIPYIKF